jgi:hypothetical protein
MSRLFRVLLKAVGLKTLLRWGWRYAIYPKLKEWTESNDVPEWDEKILKFVNDNINKAIDLI